MATSCSHRVLWPAAVACSLAAASPALAWETAGHALVAETAARLLAAEQPWLSHQAFVLAYYANAPDLVWKGDPSVEPRESPEHYINLESFPELQATDGNRQRYFATHPEVKLKDGRAPWRIAELDERLGQLARQLHRKDLKVAQREALTAQWVQVAGILAHYVADMGVPLHTSNNYDGQKTGQRGLHHFYEGTLVDAMMPELTSEVYRRALAQRSTHSQPQDAFAAALSLARASHAAIPALLATDKKLGRNDLPRALEAHGQGVVDRLVQASLVLAKMWQRHLGWTPAVGDLRVPPPAFIEPGWPESRPPASTSPSKSRKESPP